ncbi:hypothetical protein ABZ920_14180 [Streptomyces sp. NPDC046831]|uniref:baeRF2 domain-containing protein n=1 Tax=Streptomyces sp. NPDC046831 TaxID=3154805 RepID=UPI0033E76009
MRLSFLDPLYAAEGPVASVCLDTSRDIDDPDRAIELRWRHAREKLAAEGADRATLSALGGGVGADRDVDGPHGQALFAADGQVLLAQELPRPPERDTARYSRLPDAMPLAVQRAPDISYLAVVISREGPADAGPGAGPSGEADSVVASLQAGRWPASTVAPQPVSSYAMPAAQWQQGAVRVTEAAERAVRDHGSEVIVVWAQQGDPWPRGVFVNRLPPELHERVITVDGEEPPRAAPGRALLEQDLANLLDGRLGDRDRTHFDRYLAQRSRHRASCEGMAAAVRALQRGQVQALFVNDQPGPSPARLWTGPEPTHIALSAEELEAFGAPAVAQEPADALLIRAAAHTGAELVVVPYEELALDDGVGALLRYTTPAP